ncbi:MAG: glycoside hydrolase domain-containing protein [Thermoguttaceae bacterium]|jgi:hypothetical protein
MDHQLSTASNNMNKCFSFLPAVIFAWMVASAGISSAQDAETGGADLLRGAIWRVFYDLAPWRVGSDGKYVERDWGGLRSLAPASNWFASDFDDREWPMCQGVPGDKPGTDKRWHILPDSWALSKAHLRAFSSYASSLQLRTRFSVSDPSKLGTILLAVDFHGGATVWLNGQELTRAHMPTGPVSFDTVAADYPADPSLGRDREMRFTVPATALRSGVNTLAIQINRSAYRPECFNVPKHAQVAEWSPIGLWDVRLTVSDAKGLATLTPKPIRIWNAGAMTMVGFEVREADPFRPLGPVVLRAPRGGVAWGQVVVNSDTPLNGFFVAPGELTSSVGTIPAKAIQVRYAHKTKRDQPNPYAEPNPYDGLHAKPDPHARLHPMGVCVQVPADAKGGLYKGSLELSGVGQGQKIQVELTVYDWVMPPLSDRKVGNALFQSPGTLADTYGTALWSEEHWKHVGRSLALMKELNPKMLLVNTLTKTAFGKDPLVVFKKEGARYTPDLTNARRYLQEWQKQIGEPYMVCLHLWDVTVQGSVPVLIREGDTVKPGALPDFGEAGSEQIWKETVEGLRQIMGELGWKKSVLMLGTLQDHQPKKNVVEFFAANFPKMPWSIYSHASWSPKGMQVGFFMSPCAQGKDFPCFSNHRDGLVQSSGLTQYRIFPMLDIMHWLNQGTFNGTTGLLGSGGMGFDYWEVKLARNGTSGHWMAFNNAGWGNIVRGAVGCFIAPGPDGAVPTVRYEVYRQGLQECEALAYIYGNKTNPKLPSDMAQRIKALHAMTSGQILVLFTGADVGWNQVQDQIYTCAADIAKALSEP